MHKAGTAPRRVVGVLLTVFGVGGYVGNAAGWKDYVDALSNLGGPVPYLVAGVFLLTVDLWWPLIFGHRETRDASADFDREIRKAGKRALRRRRVETRHGEPSTPKPGADKPWTIATSGGWGAATIYWPPRLPSPSDPVLISLPDFRVTNRDPVRALSLDIWLRIPAGVFGQSHDLVLREGDWRSTAIPPERQAIEMRGPFLECPLRVDPGDTVRGTIAFLAHGVRLKPKGERPDLTTAELRIVEYGTERELRIPAIAGRHPETVEEF